MLKTACDVLSLKHTFPFIKNHLYVIIVDKEDCGDCPVDLAFPHSWGDIIVDILYIIIDILSKGFLLAYHIANSIEEVKVVGFIRN